MCINAQIPAQLGGLGAKAVYFDTNFGFHPGRLQGIISGLLGLHLSIILGLSYQVYSFFSTEIASACVRHCQKLVQIHKKELTAATRDFTIDRLMNGVYYRHIHGCSEMLEGIETLERLLKSGEKVIDLKP